MYLSGEKSIMAFGDAIIASAGSAFAIGKFLLCLLLVIGLEAAGDAFVACVVGLACLVRKCVK